MIDFLLGVPGKLTVIKNWLTTYWTEARAIKIDFLTAEVAPKSTAVSNTDLTPTRAAKLDYLGTAAVAPKADPLISPPIATGWYLPLDPISPKVAASLVYTSCAAGTHSTAATSYTDAVNITGSGVLNLITQYAGSSANAYIRVTIDSIIIINGVVTTTNTQKVFVGCISASDATATGCSVSLDQIPFRTSLRIEHYTSNASYQSTVIWKLRRTT